MDMMERRGGKNYNIRTWNGEKREKREREAYICTAQRTYRKKEMKKRMKIFFLK